jgi:hypothetical protein
VTAFGFATVFPVGVLEELHAAASNPTATDKVTMR